MLSLVHCFIEHTPPCAHVEHFPVFMETLTLTSDSNYYAARILRAIRIAARLGFRISKETANSIKNLSYSILRLDKVV